MCFRPSLGRTEPGMPAPHCFPAPSPLLLSPVSGHASIYHLSSSCLQPSELARAHLALKVVKNMGGSVNMQVCCLHGAPHQAPGKHGEIRLIFQCASRCLSSCGHPGVFSVLRRICLSRRMCLPSVHVCSDAAEHIHTKGTRVLLLWNKLTQTFFPQDCLGLPSNPTALCSADARLGWIFPIFNLFSGWVLLCSRRLSSKVRRGSPSKQVGPGRWGRTPRSSEGPQHLFSEALVSSHRPGCESWVAPGDPLSALLTRSAGPLGSPEAAALSSRVEREVCAMWTRGPELPGSPPDISRPRGRIQGMICKGFTLFSRR